MPIRPFSKVEKVEIQRQDDPNVERALRDLTTVLNALVERIGQEPSNTLPEDLKATGVQLMTIGRNLYSLSAVTEDGKASLVPGLMQKSTKRVKQATDGQVLISEADGNFAPASLTAGSGITITATGGAITITNNDPAAGSNLRAGSTSLSAEVSTPVSFSSAMASGTARVGIISCTEADGSDVPCYISSVTTSGFTAECPVDATLIYIGVLDT